MAEAVFYIYGLFQKSNNRLLYIGKGKGYRLGQHRSDIRAGRHKNPKYGVSYSAIYDIQAGRRWKHLRRSD